MSAPEVVPTSSFLTPVLPADTAEDRTAHSAPANGTNGHHEAISTIAHASGPTLTRPDVFDGSRLLNRDLSWLEFNRRVLSLAQDDRTPLLERVRFLGIFTSNLDEFMQKRLGMLLVKIKDGTSAPEFDGLRPASLLETMRSTVRQLQREQGECFERVVKPALAKEGISLVDYSVLDATQKRWLRNWFRKLVFPTLTPLAVDRGHRFPFISNLSRNFGVLLSEPGAHADAEPLFARVKIPTTFGQWVRVPESDGPAAQSEGKFGKGLFIDVADVIAANLDDLFPGMQLVEIMPFRVIRDSENPGSDEQGDEDADNLLQMVEAQLKQRRFAKPVRIEVGANPSERILEYLFEELELGPSDTEAQVSLLDYTSLNEIADLDRPELKWQKWTPTIPKRIKGRSHSMFDIIRAGDLLVHHPFESFEASATRFIQEASRDPDVLAIKQTIYRTSRESPFVQSLIRAAEQGKQVAVLVELRARFDEQANVKIAHALEKAGAHVAYGVLGYKTHCKAAMVVRKEGDTLRTYCHLGTGNYHPRTAQLYTDLGLFTCEPTVVEDVIELFNFLTGRSRVDTFETLLVAPVNMKRRFIDLIQKEIAIAKAHAEGKSEVGGRIVAKMNALADNEIAEQLYLASQAGVIVTLFIRGFCCVRPGVPGLSENIRIVSVLGRFLEHSRIFHFGSGKRDPLEGEWYISSADWMYRNLNNRVEASTPVLARENRAKLLRILQIMNADRRSAWELRSSGSYDKLQPRTGVSEDSPEILGTFETLMREARLNG